MSPGWHDSAAQMASSVEKRIARALPVFRIDRFTIVMPTRSASSVSVMRRACSRSSSLTVIAMSHGPFEVGTQPCAFGEHAREYECQQHGKPAADRKAGVEVQRMFGVGDRLAYRADDHADQLEREQGPGDGL